MVWILVTQVDSRSYKILHKILASLGYFRFLDLVLKIQLFFVF